MLSIHIQNKEENGFQIGKSYSKSREAGRNGKKEQNQQLKNGSIYAGDTNLKQDPIALKRIKAGKDAMKGVIDKFASDRKIDMDLAERQQHIQDLKTENAENYDQIKFFNEQKNSLKEEYGITDDSQEEKELELLQKVQNSKNEGGPKLTKEEEEYFKTMEPRLEYLERVQGLNKVITEIQDKVGKANNKIRSESTIIDSTKQAMLKSKTHGLIDAVKVKDEMLKSASKEIIGMLLEEAKEQIDDEMAKNKEEADKITEEKAKKEKEAEAARAAKEAEEAKEEKPTTAEDDILKDTDKYIEQLNKEIQIMIKNMKLLEEDTKGIAVDWEL